MSEERELLKARAEKLGVEHKANIPTDKLRDLIAEKLNAEETAEIPEIQAAFANKKVRKIPARIIERNRARRAAGERKRVIVTCLNPDKAQWHGEVITARNDVAGVHRVFVPFSNSNGWYVPNIVLNVLRERKFQSFRSKKLKDGTKTSFAVDVPEFTITELPELTAEQVNNLKIEQARSNRLED